MYIKCRIEFVDDNSQSEVIIKASDEYLDEKEDDYIFFYGLTENQIREMIDKKEVCEGEWKILEIIEVSDELC